jgi:exodeoxyribonuclease-3
MRIDHILVTEPLKKRLQEVWIDRDERKGKRPSDHVPVVATFSD